MQDDIEMSNLEREESIRLLEYIRHTLQNSDEDFHTGVKAQWVMEFNEMLGELKRARFTVIQPAKTKPKNIKKTSPLKLNDLNIRNN